MPGWTAPRSGLAFAASSPSVIARSGTPAIATRPSVELEVALRRTRNARRRARRIFSRTATAPPRGTALPATTAPRLAKVPAPQWNWSVSPVTTSTSRDVDAELLGDDLREAGEVPLALRADAGGDASPCRSAAPAPARPRRGRCRCLRRSTTTPMPDVPALGAQPRLLLAHGTARSRSARSALSSTGA